MEITDSDSQDILSGLRTFVAGASRSHDVDHKNLVKTSITLLKTLPPARDSILEYFGSVFHNYVNRYLSLLEVLSKSYSWQFTTFSVLIFEYLQDGTMMMSATNDNDILLEEEIPLIQIQNVLCDFVQKNSEAWAPIVSTWSLELLGKYATRFFFLSHHNFL